jgi:hypothetical protein
MSREENNYKLLVSIISQMSTNGQLRGIDWALVAADLGLDRAATASVRWARFKKSSGLSLPGSNGTRTSNKVTKLKAEGGGGRNGGKKTGGAGKGGAKKKDKKSESGGEVDEAYGGDDGHGGAEVERNDVHESGLGEGEQEEMYGDAQEYFEEGHGKEEQDDENDGYGGDFEDSGDERYEA